MPEPTPPDPDPHAGPLDGVAPERLAEDLAELDDLVATGFEVDGPVARIGETTWAIYGHSAYDGEIIVGEYPDPTEAAEVLDAAPHLEE